MKNIIDAIFSLENADSVWAKLLGTAPVSNFASMIKMVMPFVLLGICVLLLFFGKKLLPLWKVLGCFFAVFFFVLTPLSVFGAEGQDNSIIGLINSAIGDKLSGILEYAVAAVFGVLAALLSKFIAILVYLGGVGFVGFFLVNSGKLDQLLENFGLMNLKMVIAIAVGVVFAVLALVLRKFIAKAGTAAIGAYGIMYVVTRQILGAETWQGLVDKIGMKEGIAGAFVVAVFFLVGFLVQLRTNRKYKV